MSTKAKVKGRGKQPKSSAGYKMAEKLKPGTILQDIQKKQWISGAPLGQGGFGLIYQAKSAEGAKDQYPYVIKIEPHENGPLFVEMHFYMRNAKKEDVEGFIKSNSLKSLGMPLYIGSGSHEYNSIRHRFIIMERFGEDLWNKFLKCDRQFPESTVYRLALQILDVIQYIHERGYVHADIKGGNILLGIKKGTENQVYLVDFGLAGHYNTKEYKPDPKKMHNGTIEYTSRDAHNGVLTRRGDMEILGYNLVQWLAGKLPWEDNLTNPVTVHNAKETAMSNVSTFLKKTFNKTPPTAISSFMEYVAKMKPDDEPDYKKCQQIFETGLKASGGSKTGNLEFGKTAAKPASKLGKRSAKAKDKTEDEIELDEEETPPSVKKSKVLKPANTKKKLLNISPLPIKSTPLKTPKKVLTNTIATQTSLEKQTPNSLKRTRRAPVKTYRENSTSDADCIENSFSETPTRTVTQKRKHTKRFEVNYSSDEEVVVHTTIKKKNGDAKAWQKCPSILNGKAVQK